MEFYVQNIDRWREQKKLDERTRGRAAAIAICKRIEAREYETDGNGNISWIIANTQPNTKNRTQSVSRRGESCVCVCVYKYESRRTNKWHGVSINFFFSFSLFIEFTIIVSATF